MKLFSLLFSLFLAIPTQASTDVNRSSGWPICDPSVVTWHPHPLTCTQYILCFYGNTIERPCAPGLHFNANLQQCMLPQLAHCDLNYACPPEDDVLNPIYLPDPDDCTKYFVCFRGSPIERECAADLWFDVEYQWCTVADSVTCDVRTPNDPNRPSSSTPGLITTTTIPPTTTTTSPTTTTSTIATTTAPPITRYDCPLVSGTSLHPHPQNCQLFFECINGISFMRQCQRGFIFDVDSRTCQPEDSARCVLD